MNKRSESPSLHDFDDPRCRAGFQPLHYPKVNGGHAPPPGATERNDRIKLAFLAVYYGLNCQYARLLEVRSQPDSDRRTEDERRTLQAVEELLILRDRLEDQYAPFGVIAEPAIEDGFTVNVKICFGNVDGAGRRRSDLYTLTACVPIPLPGGIKFEDLPIKIEGPGIRPD